MDQNTLLMLQGIQPEELSYIESLTQDLTPEQQKRFVMLYGGKRKDPQSLLLFTLIGLLGVSGIQRFVINQVGMGILYLLTGGLCLIGTILDIINYKKMANEFNFTQANEAHQMAKSA